SAVEPAKPTTTLPSAMRRTLLAVDFITVLPNDTCPSPAITTRPLRRTPRMVVPLNIVTFFVYRAFLHRALRSKHRISVAKPRVANRGRAGRAVLWVVAFGPRPPDRRSQMNDAYDPATLAPGRDTASLVESVSRTISCNYAP